MIRCTKRSALGAIVIGAVLAGCTAASAQDLPGVGQGLKAPQRPGEELKGLNTLSVVVEGLGSQAASCGLSESTLRAAAAKSLSDVGLKVLRDSDEDTYLYVNVNSSRVPSGICVSRYDVILYSYTTARMTYGSAPVLVQVSLLRDAGMAGGDPASNGEAVVRAVKQAADSFAAQIRDANK